MDLLLLSGFKKIKNYQDDDVNTLKLINNLLISYRNYYSNNTKKQYHLINLEMSTKIAAINAVNDKNDINETVEYLTSKRDPIDVCLFHYISILMSIRTN